ncbi:CHAP domain-containing protein [Cypionkella aquatica]|nr:CHAP domain-containing protein [Cypionkella aquatica]
MAVNFLDLAAVPRFAALCGILALTAACVPTNSEVTMLSSRPDLLEPGLNPNFVSKAIGNAKAKRAKGQKVWCVPFARDASGVEIKGNAGTWWDQAKGKFQRGHAPVEGAVMAFSSTRKLPKGHVAVVSEVVSDREILIDHANWKPSQISLGMTVVDVSPKNDWSVVKVASVGDTLGRAYPIDGFIWNAPTQATLLATTP